MISSTPRSHDTHVELGLGILNTPNVRFWVAGAVVLLCATFLRFYSLSSQGFMQWDEGLYALEGQFLADTWQHLLSGASSYTDWAPQGRSPAFMRPLHSFFISVAMLIGGVSAPSALAMSAVAGLLTIVLVLAIGWRVYSPSTGLLAGALLATMPLHVIYSRQVLAEADGTLAVTLSLALYWLGLRAQARRMLILAASGLLLGLSLTTNMRVFVVVPVFALMELWLWAGERRHSRFVFLRRFLVLAYSAIFPLLVATAFFWCLERYFQASGIALRWPIIPYVDQFAAVWNFKNSLPRPLYGGLDPLYYPYVLWNFAGPSLVICTLLFFPTVLQRGVRKTEWMLVAFWLLVPIILSCVYSDKAPRYISLELPVMALAGARGATWASGWLAAKLRGGMYLRVLPLGVAALAILSGFGASYAATGQASGYPQASAYVLDHGARGVIAGQPLPVEFYTGQSIMTAAIPEDPSLLQKGYQLGYKYLLIDDHAYLGEATRAVATDVERLLKPEIVFDDSLKEGPLFYLEYSETMTTSLAATLTVHDQTRATRGASQVRVYDLERFLNTSKQP